MIQQLLARERASKEEDIAMMPFLSDAGMMGLAERVMQVMASVALHPLHV